MSVDPVAIARSGLDAEWQRLAAIALNLANENTAASASGTYRPRNVVTVPAGAFAAHIESGDRVPDPEGVRAILEFAAGAGRRVYEPGHPAADEAGFVTYPDIDHAAQMALLMQTARAYESNLAVVSLAQQMSMRALGMGRR